MLLVFIASHCTLSNADVIVNEDASYSQVKDSKIRVAPGVDLNDPITSFETVEGLLDKYLPEKELKQVRRVLFGKGMYH